MAYQTRLRLKLNGAKWVNGSDVEKLWQEFRSVVMETAEGVGEKISAEMTSRELDGGMRR